MTEPARKKPARKKKEPFTPEVKAAIDEAKARKREELRAAGLPVTKGAKVSRAALQQRKADRKEAMVKMVSEGMTIRAACETLGITIQTINSAWYKQDPEFKTRLQAARLDAERRKRDEKQGKVNPRYANALSTEFTDFRETFFSHKTAPHHLLMVEAIESARPGELSLILAFPGAGKSTLLTDYLNYRVALDPNIRIAMFSESQQLARKSLGQIARRMTDSTAFPAYIGRFGPFRTPVGSVQKDFIGRVTGNPWTADYLRVHKATHDEKEFTLESKGVGSALYGGRYDFMLYDDLQSTKNLSATDSILTWLRQDALTRPGHDDGGHVFIGSRVGRGDIYSTLEDEQMLARIVRIPALDRWVDRDDMYVFRNGRVELNPNCPAKPTWDNWSLLALAQRRHLVKEEIWTRTYMQTDFLGTDVTFTDLMLAKVKDTTLEHGEKHGTYTILSVDPALDSGVCAFLVAGCNADSMTLTELRLSKEMRRYEDIYDQIGQLAGKFKPTIVVVEQNNFQKGMLQDDRLIALSRRHGFLLHAHQTGRNKHDPVLGVMSMASAFTEAEIRVPWCTPEDQDMFRPLFDELRSWVPTKRGSELKMDAVMALWFAWLQWENVRRSLLINPASNVIRRDVPSWMRSRGRGIA